MKVVFSVFLFLSFLEGIAQFDPSKEWFVLEDFFEQKQIESNQIKGITIYKSDKKDNEAFNAERKIVQYSFSEKGRLLESQKFVPMSRRIDTSIFEFKYNNDKLLSRIENQGPFRFKYAYLWLNDSVFEEVKIDEKTLDTNYIHRIEIQQQTEHKIKYTYYSSIGRPMKSEWVTINSFDNIISKRQSYSRSLSFVEDSFNYKATQLISKSKWNTIGRQKKTIWKFTYENGYLDFIKKREDGEVVAKFAILYNDRRLIKSIVKRDIQEKTISIYKVEYEYYSTEK